MAEPLAGHRQVLDVRAAIIAALLASIVFLVTVVLFDTKFLHAPWFTVRGAASIVAGVDSFKDPVAFHSTYVPLGIAILMLGAIPAALLIAFLLHQFGIVMGVIGGAVLGFCFYVINYYSLAEWLNLPAMTEYKRWTLEVAHVLFGAVAGGVYEWLERARYVRR